MWFDKTLSSIAMIDLDALIRDQVRESRMLDYKDEAPAHVSAPPDKKSEFATDVSALANGSGGTLVYGVSEQREGGRPTGVPDRITGLPSFNIDAEETRLRSYLDTGLDPRLPTGSIEFHAVPGGPTGPILLVRVRKSLLGPHMVRADGRFRNTFYVRDGAKNRQLDALGIREAFASSGDWSRRLRGFRQERLALIAADETPAALAGQRKIVLHVLPIESLSSAATVDPRDAKRIVDQDGIVPLAGTDVSRSHQFNADGLVVRATQTGAGFLGYLQVFRSGTLETVDSYILNRRDVRSVHEMGTLMIETELLATVPRYFGLLGRLGLAPPYVVALSLMGVRNMQHSEQRAIDLARGSVPSFDRDLVVVPEVVVDAEDLSKPIPASLKPILDSLWQAGGVEGCPRFVGDTYDASLRRS